MVTEYTVANSFAVWQTFDQLSYKFENIGMGVMPPTPPIGTSLLLSKVDSGCSHTKCYKEKYDYERRVTLSGVA